jgi:hypothetical protein
MNQPPHFNQDDSSEGPKVGSSLSYFPLCELLLAGTSHAVEERMRGRVELRETALNGAVCERGTRVLLSCAACIGSGADGFTAASQRSALPLDSAEKRAAFHGRDGQVASGYIALIR